MERDEQGRRDAPRHRAGRTVPRGSRTGRAVRAARNDATQDASDTAANTRNPGAAVLQNAYIRRYLGQFIHATTRDDIVSRVAVHCAIPALTSDLVQLFDLREGQLLALTEAAGPLARYAHSRDVTLAEQDRLCEAWAALLDSAPSRQVARALARRQIDVWHVTDALPWLASALPQTAAFLDGLVRAPDIAAEVAVRVGERNNARLRRVASALSDTVMPPMPGRRAALCEALIDVLAAVYRVDLRHGPSAAHLCNQVALWQRGGWLTSLRAALPLEIGPRGHGLAGIAHLGEGLRSTHRYTQRMARAEEVYDAAQALALVDADAPLAEQPRFRMIYALHDALRDNEDRPSATVDAIAAQCEIWRTAGWLPLLSAATIYDYFYLDGRLRLADIDAHLSREFALMRTLPRGIRDGFYEEVYDDVSTDDEASATGPPIGWSEDDEASPLALASYVDGRSIEHQFRIMETILLRETTDAAARTYLRRGLDALQHSPLLAMFDAGFAAGWYETLLLDPIIAPFNVQYIAILHESLALGVDIDGQSPDWVGVLQISPRTFSLIWRQRAAFRTLTDRYRSGAGTPTEIDSPDIGVDAYLMFSAGIGDRRVRAVSRWVDRTVPAAIADLAPVVVRQWVDLLLDRSISDAAVDAWLAGTDDWTFADGMPSPDETRRTMAWFDATRPTRPRCGAHGSTAAS